jgi:hypothetical protein
LATIAELNEESLIPPCALEVKERRKSLQMKAEPVEVDQLMSGAIMEEEEKEEKDLADMPEVVYHSMNILEESHPNIG